MNERKRPLIANCLFAFFYPKNLYFEAHLLHYHKAKHILPRKVILFRGTDSFNRHISHFSFLFFLICCSIKKKKQGKIGMVGERRSSSHDENLNRDQERHEMMTYHGQPPGQPLV